MRPRRLLASCAALALLAHTAAAVEPAPAPVQRPLYWRLKASIGYHFSSGDYTGTETTQIQYVPLVLTADVERWRIQGTIPFLAINGPPGIITVNGVPVETISGRSEGLGDVLLRGSYLLPVERFWPADEPLPVWLPYMDLIGLVKFPTGSRSKGLGTGEFDFGIDTDLTWSIGRFSPFLTLGCRILGSPPDTHLNDVFDASLGLLYRFLPSLSGGALIDYRQAPTASSGQQLELVPYTSWTIFGPWSLDSYISIGLSNGSPDVGVGTQLGYTW